MYLAGHHLLGQKKSANSEEIKFRNSALRLGIISLKAVNQFFDKDTFDQFGGGGDAKILWKITKNVMEKAFGQTDTYTALHLMANLIYFDSNELDDKVFRLYTRKFLSILETCGLIHVQKLGKMIKLRKPSTIILEEFIRQQNKSNEELDLRHHFRSLKFRKARFPVKTHPKYFIGLWRHAVNHENLVKELIENYHDEMSFIFDWRSWFVDSDSDFGGTIMKTLEQVRKIFGELNELTLEFHFHKMYMILESDDCTNRFKLNQSRELIWVCERFHHSSNSNSHIYPRIGKIALELYIVAINDLTLSDDLKAEFLEESLWAHTMVWKDLKQRNPKDLLNNKFTYITWLGMFKSLNALKKYDQTGQLLNEICKLLLKYGEEDPYLLEQSFFGFSDYWDDILSEVTGQYSDCDIELPNDDFRIIIKFIFEFILDKLKKCNDWGDNILYVAKAYLLCLNKVQDFDQILTVIRETNQVWIQKLNHEISEGRWVNLEVFLLDAVNDYFDFHKLLLKIIRDMRAGIGNGCVVQDAVLMEPIEFSKSVVKKAFQTGEEKNKRMTPDDYRNGGHPHIISCYTYLGRIDELIRYSSEYKQLLMEKFGHKHNDFASEWCLYLKTLSENINSISSHVNVQKMIESVESWAKDLSERSVGKSESENELVKSNLKEIAEKLDTICEKRSIVLRCS